MEFDYWKLLYTSLGVMLAVVIGGTLVLHYLLGW